MLFLRHSSEWNVLRIDVLVKKKIKKNWNIKKIVLCL